MSYLTEQVALEESHQKSYVDLSLTDTLTQLIMDNHSKEADKIKIDFKVPDKRSLNNYARVYYAHTVQYQSTGGDM